MLSLVHLVFCFLSCFFALFLLERYTPSLPHVWIMGAISVHGRVFVRWVGDACVSVTHGRVGPCRIMLMIKCLGSGLDIKNLPSGWGCLEKHTHTHTRANTHTHIHTHTTYIHAHTNTQNHASECKRWER